MDKVLLFKEESYKIVGACFEVYHEKGCGFLEPVYQECMELELRLQDIPFLTKKPLALDYKGSRLRATYQPDFICYDKIVVELKAVTELADEHRAQVLNYLKATDLSLALLVNFGHYPKAQVERIITEKGRYAHCYRGGDHREPRERERGGKAFFAWARQVQRVFGSCCFGPQVAIPELFV